ncbi:MAG: exodeoxyribonuclease V subunit beta [Azoarcus sp.]|jgi:exodeoxyribonuclease V beta subunit|nr:exodeoxyribonuclease V subunit beta [Azoarcus sp.]
MTPATELNVFTCPLDGIALIEASAGTGKTWNICGLYLRQLLEKDLPVSRLLVVTFTRAATAELSTRIRSRILAALRTLEGAEDDDPFTQSLLASAHNKGITDEEMKWRLRNALASFDEAAIFTIHGFCQRALADAAFSAGLPQKFEVSEDDGSLYLDVARDFWRREIMNTSPALADYLLACRDSPERWATWLKNAQATPLAQFLWDEADNSEALTAAFNATEDAYRAAQQCWDNGGKLRQILMDMLDKGGLNKNSYKEETIETAFQQWSAWLASNSLFMPLGYNETDKRHLFGAAAIAKGTRKNFSPPEHPFFDAAQTLLDARLLLDSVGENARRGLLRRFIEQSGSQLRARKQTERRIHFNDMLWNAFDAIQHRPWLAETLHARYPVALIDEFQDTDPLQLAIFSRIYLDADKEGNEARGGNSGGERNDAGNGQENRRGTLFLVGDPKQAIYKFRAADLHTYLGARHLADTHYTLSINRRASPALVAACNQIFGANPAVFIEKGLDFLPAQAGEFSQTLDDPAGPRAALHLWRLPNSSSSNSEQLLRADALERAANATAAEIARLLAAGQRSACLINSNPLAPADLAVLVRTHKEGKHIRNALAAQGIGSIELSQSSVFASPEAEELERVLMAIATPTRERLIKTALATTLMGQDADALARLSHDDSEFSRHADCFNQWHQDWQQKGFAVMLWRWMNESHVAARLLALQDGERRLTNLLHLAELLQTNAGGDSPTGLLRSLARQRAEGKGGDSALLRLESDRNLVQIVTIHRAKGLQYNIVFCPFLFDGYSKSRAQGPMRLWHDDNGEQIADWRQADDPAIKARLAKEESAEILRLIYVALTRAVHRCVLVVGCYGKQYKNTFSTKESAHSHLNWLVSAAGQGFEAWRESDIKPNDIEAGWQALANASKGAISLEDLPTAEAVPPSLKNDEAQFTAPPPPTVPAGWRIGSYSALVSGAVHEDAARDHDARADTWTPDATPPETLPEPPAPKDDFLYFPRGAAAGDCVHAVFEAIDFTQPKTHPAALHKALKTHPPDTADTAGLWQRMLSNMLANVINAPLIENSNGPLRLETIPTQKRLTEFSFYLPAPRLNIDKLNEWLAAHGYSVPRLTSRHLTGYLKGYIDLVFEHAGQYWILDWKTNHLGNTQAAYAPAMLEAAMRQHGYHLQHLLYTLALHRYLRHTLPHYHYAQHFGGVLYLFVRGIRPAWQIANKPTGVFHHLAPAETIESLDRLMAGG